MGFGNSPVSLAMPGYTYSLSSVDRQRGWEQGIPGGTTPTRPGILAQPPPPHRVVYLSPERPPLRT